jgi:beta-glucosidase
MKNQVKYPRTRISDSKQAVCLILIFSFLVACSENSPKYKDPSIPVAERVTDLLKRMTLEEKVAQMVSVNNEVKDSIVFDSMGNINIDRVKQMLPYGVGEITRPSETKGGQSQTSNNKQVGLTPYENAVLSNKLQKYFLEETRLGIPAIFHEECLHGLVAAYATSYPSPIAIASSFDRKIVEKVYSNIAAETRLRGSHQALTPVVDVARDPRWGRVEETFGEDPYLVSQIGIAAVLGFQGDGSFKDKKHIAATLKHFVGHGQPESGTNTGPVNLSERTLREVHFFPFKEIIQKAGALSVMPTYHEVDGIPVCTNHWLLTDILRDEMGFKGFAVSDYFAIREMYSRYGINSHRVARDASDAAGLAINAGVNMELPSPDCYKSIPELVKEGKISEKQIDKLVGEILYVKFRLQLFDDPYTNPKQAQEFASFEANRELAKQAALESIVLLKNKDNFAPLNIHKIKSIAVIGPNADRKMLGGYSGEPSYYTTLLQGIKEKVGEKIKVYFSEGCRITIGGSWVEDKVTYPNPEEEKVKIAEALAVAKKADVIVLALGGNEQVSREAWNIYHLGDRSSLDLAGMQNELFNALFTTGKPIMVVLFNGAPLSINSINEKANTIYECWYLGQESGNAVADVLFGDFCPGGKLPITFPRSAGQIPAFYNHKPSARRGYIDSDIKPLYDFGFGLSYTKFQITNLRLNKDHIKKNEDVLVMADVKNTGSSAGDEVVQMYIRDELSSVTRPIKELKDFERVSLQPGETKTIKLSITPEKLSFYNIDMKYVVEPGDFTIMVGNSSRDEDLQSIKLTVE